MGKIIDTHCHPNLNKIKDSTEVIFNFFNGGGNSMIVIASDVETGKDVLSIANTNKNIYATIAIHPIHVDDVELEAGIKELKRLYSENKDKIVAVGEAGLDYHWLEQKFQQGTPTHEIHTPYPPVEGKEKQKRYFRAQIDLARELNLPLIIHNREAFDDTFSILKEKDFKNFIFHSWSENLGRALEILRFAPNSMMSFSGVVTFKNAKDIQEVAKNIPIQNILAETDSPYLTPTPFRGKEENEPIFTKYIVEKIAELRGENYEFIEDEIYKNSKRVFGI